mmetsp:Transcript_4236/g.4760  ORF Transcript_4236/g.4760 Transcript_4236/m.4760 type:complete len:2377 (+) Transcript_4236:252-7382(+)
MVSTVTAAVTAIAFIAILIMLPIPTNSQSFGYSRDFDEFNKIFENASIIIPEEFKVSERVAFVDLNMNIWNIKCYDMNVGDITVNHQQKLDIEFLVTVGIAKLDLTCEMEYDYEYGILSGDGWVQIQTDNSEATSTILFKTPDSRYPPTDSFVDNCFSDVNIKRMDFEEDFVSEIVEVFQGLVRNTMETAIGDVACEELSVVGTSVVGNMVALAKDQLYPYLDNLGEAFTDPLYDEQNLILPNNFKPLNLQDTEGQIGNTFNEILKYIDTIIGTTVTDDLAVNVFLRSFLLDKDRSFRIDPSSIPTMKDPILFKGHDRVTEFAITLNEVRLYGLDSITRLNAFRNIGRNTIQNELTWDTLRVEFDVQLDLQPSTLDDAILIDPTSPGISERFSIDFTIDNIDVEASLLLVLDEDTFGNIELGPLFYTEHFLPCLLSIVQEAKVSGLDVDPTFINNGPTVTGFIDPGLDRIITNSVEAAFTIYKDSLRSAIPNIFQTSVRELINTFSIDAYKNNKSNTICPKVQPFEEGFIDFRQLFDSNDSNDGIYGDLLPMLKNMLDEKLLAIDAETLRPRINEALVAPFTAAQSGTEGMYVTEMDLVNFLLSKNVSQQFGLDSLELRVFDPKIENIDSIGSIELLEPNATNGQLLDNYARLGSFSRKLRISLKGLFATEGDPTYTMHNEMDMSVELVESEVWASLMAYVDTAKLFNFPLRDITNLQCWLYTLKTPDSIYDAGEETGFSIVNALLSATSMNFNVTCASCTSSSLSILSEVLQSLEDFGISDVLEMGLVELILDILHSDYIQNFINRSLIDSALRCPQSPQFIGPSASLSENSPSPKLPFLDLKSLETIVFAFTVVTEIAAVVMAQSHESYDLESTFPLSGQNNLRSTDDVRLVDFTSLETSVGEWASSGVDNLIEFLNEGISAAKGTNNERDLRVNDIIRSSLLGENGSLSISFDNINLAKAGVEIFFKEIRIFGFDTISELNVFDAIGAQTLQNKISWQRIRIQLVVSLEDQDITICVSLSDVNLSLAMFVAMNYDHLNSIQLKGMMEIKNILPCLMSAAHAASITEFEVAIGSVTEFSIEGFNSNDISSAASESSRLMLEKYGDKIISSVPKFFDSTLRGLLNNWIQYYNNEEFPAEFCKYSSSNVIPGSGYVDLRDLLFRQTVARQLGGNGFSQYGDMFRTAMRFVWDIFKIDESTGLSRFNDVIVAPLTVSNYNESGTIHYNGDLIKGGKRIQVGALDTNVQFRVYDTKIENLDTFGAPLELFGGIMGEAYMLNNTMTLGIGENPLKFSSKFLLSLADEGGDNIKISNEVDLSLQFADANIIFSTMTKIAETNFSSFPLRDMLDLNCWLATIPAPALDSRGVRLHDSELTASISNLKAHIGKLIVTATCTNCSSPKMTELTNLLSSQATQIETTDVANALLDYLTQLMGGNFLQLQIDRVLNDAARKCPHSSRYDPYAPPSVYDAFDAPNISYSMGRLVMLGALALAMVIIVLLIVLAVKYIVRRRHKKWLIKLPPHQMKKLAYQQKSELDMEDKLNITTTSMFRSSDIPCLMRLLIPIVIVLNVVFFLSGHLSLGATVNIEAEMAGDKFTIEKFFEFSMARSTIDIWKAGGRELAVLIVIFSGIWPYTKLILTLWLWFSSPSSVSISRRGSIFLWLDWLAKWSMLDIFVMVISIAAFRISIQSPDTSYLPDDFYAIEMMVIPLWGLYANMIAQLISQITSHVIIYYHRRIVTNGLHNSLRNVTSPVPASAEARTRPKYRDPEALGLKMQSCLTDIGQEQSHSSASLGDIPVDQNIGISIGGTSFAEAKTATEEKISLSSYQFSRPHRGETEKLLVRSYVKFLLPICALLLLVCVIVGCTLPSFSLEFFGLVGVAVEFGQDFKEATVNHSVLSVIRLLFDQASYLGTLKDYIGLTILSVLFVSTVMFVPTAQSITLLHLWFSKSTIPQKKKTAVRLEILQAWQYLEVYLIALFVSSWQLGPVSDFMINAYCNNLEDMFAQLVYYGFLKEEDAQCFSVTSRIENSAFVLAAGAILLTFLSSFVCKAVVQYLRDEADTQLQGKGDFNSSFSDGTSHSDDDDTTTDTGVAANIHPVPVLFTDSFRWMLKASNSVSSSSRTLFAGDPDTSHWSLPEATVIADENSHSDGRVIKGTFVSNLGRNEMVKSAMGGSVSVSRGSLRQSRQGSVGSLMSNSYNSCRSSTRERRLTYDDDTDEKHYCKSPPREYILKNEERDSISSLDQNSIKSMMDSVGSSSKGGHYGVSASPGSSRKAPPPANYRLSGTSLKKPPPSHYSTITTSTERNQSPSSSPPLSPRSISEEEDYQRASINSGHNEATSTVKNINDTIEKLDYDTDEYFGHENSSQHSNSHRRFI